MLRNNFKIYDTTGFINKPDLSLYGILPMLSIYEYFFQIDPITHNPPSTQTLVTLFNSLMPKYGNQAWSLDIEQWSILTGDVNQNISRLISVITAAKQVQTKYPVGYYSFPPQAEIYNVAVGDINSTAYKSYLASDRLAIPLAALEDYIAPSIYVIDYVRNDPVSWTIWATRLMDRSRIYGKPIYPYIWMRESSDTYDIDPLFWRYQLELIYKLADGIILWGGFDLNSPTYPNNREWDNSAAWWKATQDFINRTPFSYLGINIEYPPLVLPTNTFGQKKHNDLVNAKIRIK